jgi:hypothetical protein
MPAPFPSNGTDAEKRAWADAQTAPIKGVPSKSDQAAATSRAPIKGVPSDSDQRVIESLYARDGGYIRKRGESDTHTDHSRDGR